MKDKISLGTARRIALAAQGFGGPRPAGRVGRSHLRRVLARTGLFQIDSVSAVVRAHYMPMFSRLGPYDMGLLDAAAGRKRLLFEYWAHEASLLPLETFPLMRWRMQEAERNEGIYRGLADWARGRAGFIDEVYAQIVDRAPLAASDIAGAKAPAAGGAGATPRQLWNGFSGPAA